MESGRGESGLSAHSVYQCPAVDHCLPDEITVLTTLENPEISGNLLILENSWNLKYTQGIFVYQMIFIL